MVWNTTHFWQPKAPKVCQKKGQRLKVVAYDAGRLLVYSMIEYTLYY